MGDGDGGGDAGGDVGHGHADAHAGSFLGSILGDGTGAGGGEPRRKEDRPKDYVFLLAAICVVPVVGALFLAGQIAANTLEDSWAKHALTTRGDFGRGGAG